MSNLGLRSYELLERYDSDTSSIYQWYDSDTSSIYLIWRTYGGKTGGKKGGKRQSLDKSLYECYILDLDYASC